MFTFFLKKKTKFEKILFRSVFRGIGQMCFCGSEWGGLAMFLAMFLYDWKAGVLALSGSYFGALVSLLFGLDTSVIYSGLFSFNTALTMAGIGCIFATCNLQNILTAIWHCFVCICLQCSFSVVFSSAQLPSSSWPFNLCMVLFSVVAFRKKQKYIEFG
ncbi:hypothetical protein RFI_18219, partial [Reticulomyxa filosa]